MLDDPAAVAAGDPGGMLSLIKGMGRQLRQGYELGRSAPTPYWSGGARSIVICGMGGSAVAGDVLRSAFGDRISCPIVVSKGYLLPRFCDPDTFVVAMSYSGDTEETLGSYGAASDKGCRLVAISSGGRLEAVADGPNSVFIRVPDDVPAPRAALGYLFASIVGYLDHVGFLDAGKEIADVAALLDHLAGRLGPDRPTDHNEAKAVASWLAGRTPVIWGSEGLAEAAALRWKTQLNENAKIPAFHSILPELDHNEVEGWAPGEGEGYAAVILRHSGEHPRIADRISATIESIATSGLDTREVHAEGETALGRLLPLIMLGDFTSTYLAILRGVDPTPVPVLSGLKSRISR